MYIKGLLAEDGQVGAKVLAGSERGGQAGRWQRSMSNGNAVTRW